MPENYGKMDAMAMSRANLNSNYAESIRKIASAWL